MNVSQSYGLRCILPFFKNLIPKCRPFLLASILISELLWLTSFYREQGQKEISKRQMKSEIKCSYRFRNLGGDDEPNVP